MNRIEAAPYIYTKGNEIAKAELYCKFFEVGNLANIKGERPVKNFGYLESNEAYAERLKKWEATERDVLFEGWYCKDLRHWQLVHNKKEPINIEFHFSHYKITINTFKEYDFPVTPVTIDDLINDFKRLGIKLFWKKEIAEKYGIENITSSKKVVEYHKIIDANKGIV